MPDLSHRSCRDAFFGDAWADLSPLPWMVVASLLWMRLQELFSTDLSKVLSDAEMAQVDVQQSETPQHSGYHSRESLEQRY